MATTARAAVPTAPPHTLRAVDFCLLRDRDIREMAVLEVTSSKLHNHGTPVPGGLIDSRFGVCSRFYTCGTCKNTVDKCLGHYGFIDLVYPLPLVATVPFLERLLRVFCWNCSALVLKVRSGVAGKSTALNWAAHEVEKMHRRKTVPFCCPCCGFLQPQISLDGPFVRMTWNEDALRRWPGRAALLKAAEADEVGDADDAGAPPAKRAKGVTKGRVKIGAKSSAKGGAKAADDDEIGEASEASEAGEASETSEASEAYDGPAADHALARERQRALDAELRADRAYMRRPFSNFDAKDVLTNVSDDDLRTLGIDPVRTHPSAMLMTTLLVPPLKVRPTLTTEEDSRRRGYHSLTRTLANIVKRVRVLQDKASAAHYVLNRDTTAPLPADVAMAICDLYLEVSNYMWKDKAKVSNHRMTHYAARAHARAVDLSSTLRGKRGLYRDALMGKRVNACARTVVTPAGDLDIDEMGVPRAIAEHLTVPVRVTRHNRALLERLMSQGQIKTVQDEASSTMIAVTAHNRDQLPLIEGWVVERFLRNGDFLIFNRQPTLHRPSIMAHRAVLTDRSVFEMPSPTTTPYNADHDGDEVNMHAPQTLEAVAEARNIMAVPFHIMHPGGTKPVIGLIQDAIDGGYLLSQPDCWLTEAETHELLALVRYCRDCDPGLPMGHPESRRTSPQLPPPLRGGGANGGERRWHGRQIINLILPRITLDKELPGGRGRVVIRDGCLLEGTLCSRTLGTSSGGVIHHSCLYCGPFATARFLSDAHRVFCRYLTWCGLSVGITDCLPGEGDAQRYRMLVEAAVEHVDRVRALARELPGDPAVRDAAEAQINTALKSLLFKASNVAVAGLRQQGLRNGFAIMIEDGSKGKYINMAQLGGLVGQTFVGGVRPEGCSGGMRYAPNDPLPGQAPLSTMERLLRQGLIPTPYLRGLTMPMFFNHAMAGREGLVDTAIKTARTGYMQRRAVKAMESVKCAQDYSVRDSNDMILQPRFGGDGLDTMRVMRVPLHALAMDDAQLARHVVSPLLGGSMLHFIARTAQVSDLQAVRDELRASHRRAGLLGQVDCAYLPWNAVDVLTMVRADCPRCGPRATAAADGAGFSLDGDALARCSTRLRRLLDELSQLGPALLSHCHLLETLAMGPLGRLNPCEPCFDACCERLRELYRAAMLQPGEGIGAFVATAVGEPCTQMSVVGTEEVRVRVLGSEIKRLSIAKLVDGLLGTPFAGASEEKAVSGLECYAVDPEERTRWARVTHVSRHPAAGAILKVTLADGRTVEATASHSFVVRCPSTHRVVPLRGDALRVGQHLPVNALNVAVDRARRATAIAKTLAETREAHAIAAARAATAEVSALSAANGAAVQAEVTAAQAGLSAAEAAYSAAQAVERQHDADTIPDLEDDERMAVPGGEDLSRRALSLCMSMRQALELWDPNCHTRLRARAEAAEAALLLLQAEVAARREAAGVPCRRSVVDVEAAAAQARSLREAERAAWESECSLLNFEGNLEGPIDDVVRRHPPERQAEIARDRSKYLGTRHALLSAQAALRGRMAQAERAGFKFPAQVPLLEELAQAIEAGVRWVPIVSIEARDGGPDEPVYDFTVEAACQTFMLANGVFVHNTLNTFHALNVVQAGMTYGVPRMRELLNFSAKISTPLITATVHPDLPDPAAHAAALARDLPYLKLDALVSSATNLYVGHGELDAAGEDDAELLRRHAPLLQHLSPRLSSWCLRLELGRKRAGARNLTPQAVGTVVQGHLGAGAVVLASRAVDPVWVLRVYMLDTAVTVDHALRDASGDAGTAQAVGGYMPAARDNRRYADLSGVRLSGDNAAARLQKINLHRLDCNFPERAPTAREVVEWRMMWNVREELLGSLPVAGVQGVTAARAHTAVVHEVDPETGGLVSRTLHTVAVQGTALDVVAALRGTDRSLLVCNDVMAVARQYGIDAAANVLHTELCACLASSGSRVDERLVSLLVDVMTHRGFIMPITRHGINRLVDWGVLAKITFEETLDRLFEAAVYGLRDHLRGASENLIVGRPANLGTNLSQMYVDRDGQRVPCGVAPAGYVLSGDGRAIMSVVTEYADYMREHGIYDVDVEAAGGGPKQDDQAADWNERLEHALALSTTSNVRLEAAGNASVIPGSVYAPEAQPCLYTEASALDTVAGAVSAGKSIRLFAAAGDAANVPFRPSSPLMVDVAAAVGAPAVVADGARVRTDQTEPFRPSSPPLLL